MAEARKPRQDRAASGGRQKAAIRADSQRAPDGMPVDMPVDDPGLVDFTAHRHPVMAVPRPDCHAAAGRFCRRPSGHKATAFHRSRRTFADDRFIAQHGEVAAIVRTPQGWRIRDGSSGG